MRPKNILYSVSEANEDPARCIRYVGEWHFYQCTRKRGHGPEGLFCKQHGKQETRLQEERA